MRGLGGVERDVAAGMPCRATLHGGPLEYRVAYCQGTGLGSGSGPGSRLGACRGEQPPERAVGGGEHGARALLDDPAVVEHRHEVGSGRRGEPVRHEDAGAAFEQAVGGHHDEALGHRVHPGGGLVEHDDGDVSHEEPGKGDELLLARRERGAPGAQRGVEAVGQAVDPVVEAEFGDGG